MRTFEALEAAGLAALLAAALGGAHPAEIDPSAQEPSVQTRRFPHPIDGLASEGDWEGVLDEAHAEAAFAPVGSEAWFWAQRWIVIAHEKRGELDELEHAARTALAQERRMAGAPPWAEERAPQPIGPTMAGRLFEIHHALARALQGRGMHEEALGHLRLLISDLGSGRQIDVSPADAALVGLDAGRSLLALGRWDEARQVLEAVPDHYSDEIAAALAIVHMGAIPGAGHAYGGRFAGEPRIQRTLAEIGPALERARESVAKQVERPIEELPVVLVGVADLPERFERIKAFTCCDPRRPGFPPVIVLNAATFASGCGGIEPTLVHELVHAWLWTSLGIQHEDLPPWLAEGLVLDYTNELDEHVWHVVAWMIVDGSKDALTPQFWERVRFDFGRDAPGGQPSDPGSLQAMLLGEALGGEGVRRCVAAMQAGSSWREALRSVTGMGFREYRSAAREHVEATLAERWRLVLPRAQELESALLSGPEESLRVAEGLLQEPLDPVSKGLALTLRASALQHVGRTEEAERAWNELLLAGERYSLHIDRAHLGRATCLARLGRLAEAAALYALVRETAATPSARSEASRCLAELAAKLGVR